MESSGPNASADNDISNLEGNMVRTNENIDLEEENSSMPQSPTRGGEKKRKRSAVWDHFEEKEIRGESKLVCKHCGTTFKSQKLGPTSYLERHLNACPRYCNVAEGQQMLAMIRGESSGTTAYKYDKDAVKNIMAKMLIVNELPFSVIESEMFNLLCKTLQSHYEGISQDTIRAECMNVYDTEKERLRKELAEVEKICITCDMWTCIQSKGYMRITAHYVDTEWKLQKKILNFVHVPPPHSGIAIALAIHSCLFDWKIDDKISTITLDDAPVNDVAVELLQNDFIRHGKGIFEYVPDLFHVRCCAHILDLIVQDGLNEINHVIVSVREFIKYVTGTEERKMEFKRICEWHNLPTTLTIADTSNRWGTTYLMLESAIKVKDAFAICALDTNYVWSLEADDWRKAEQVYDLLSLFYNATNVFSGSKYSTSNLFLLEIWKIKYALKENSLDPDDFMRTMVDKMQSKFDKYWSECNMLMSIAVVLDPRWKMTFVKYIFKKIYPDTHVIEVKRVEGKLHEIYNLYVDRSGSATTSRSDPKRSISAGDLSFLEDFAAFVAENEKRDAERSELQLYLKEDRVHLEKGMPFDVLSWWRQNTMKYRILSRVAQDILTIPLTTVTFEEAFSTSGKVISPCRSNLLPETLEALICAQDWLHSIHNV